MPLTERDIAFLENLHAAAMITVARDGVARTARIGVALVDGHLWSSGTSDRVRTKRLRRDPRCTLFVFDPGFAWLTLETVVTILDGPDAPQLNVRLFRQMQGKPAGPLTWSGRELDEPEFLQAMVEEGRLIYEFEVHRTYGLS
jgi:Pyridoxamine 5'-phosphate oxidase